MKIQSKLYTKSFRGQINEKASIIKSMEHFKSTDTLMKMLENGTRMCLVEADDEGVSNPEEFFEEVFDAFKDRMADPDRYAYFERRYEPR